MKIPLVDLKRQEEEIKEKILISINKIIDNTSFIRSKETEIFEKKFADYCGRKYCIAVNSGTAAIFVVLKALGIGQGDEVITTNQTFIGTTEAIRLTGAKVILVDVSEKDNLIDVQKISEKITGGTKAIIPVHLYGNVCNMDELKKIVKEKNIPIIEDCAQAHGSEYRGIKTPFDKTGCFSFFPAKILGSYGDAGAIVTDDEKIYNFARLYQDHGRESKYEHILEGFNFRISNLQSAILNVKMDKLEYWLNERNILAEKYYRELSKIKEIKFFEIASGVKHSHYMFVILVPEEKRDQLMGFLKEKEISTGIHFPITINKQPVYLKEFENDAYPASEKISNRIISIPLFPGLKSSEQDYIIENIKKFFGE
jgi:dTDP-4-amino-4,6-dideoxygalactose transaminase